MKLTVSGENLLEKAALAMGIPPVTLMHTHMSFLRARAIMVGVKLGVFDALAAGPLTAASVAERCHLSPIGTTKLLNALAGSEYLSFDAGQFALTATARKWVTADSPTSIRDKVLFEFVEWQLTEGFEDYVKTGEPLEMHDFATVEQWGLYQRAMRALSGLASPEIVALTPVPAHARTMLDIGGSHGFISVAMCRKYPNLTATVLDLPPAIEAAAPILAKENMGERVMHWPGNALEDDLGTNAWDFIYVSQLLHHFDERTNRELLRRIARALRPNGVVVIIEMLRPASPQRAGQVGALLDLYFAVTSQSGTWSIEEMHGWIKDAGLTVQPTVSLRTVPGAAEVIGAKN
jgi:2-polyprenyl-3-methyl-5-hydroxy-6-metoxy-1,4-benzoquinol methylase